jgi:hypothetical protein
VQRTSAITGYVPVFRCLFCVAPSFFALLGRLIGTTPEAAISCRSAGTSISRCLYTYRSPASLRNTTSSLVHLFDVLRQQRGLSAASWRVDHEVEDGKTRRPSTQRLDDLGESVYALFGPWEIDIRNANPYIYSPHRKGRHMYGDAADIANTGGTSDSWQTLLDLLTTVPGATVLDGTQDPKCKLTCVHVDFRHVSGTPQ